MNEGKIAKILLNELSYIYCDNCKYSNEEECANAEKELGFNPCECCHRKNIC